MKIKMIFSIYAYCVTKNSSRLKKLQSVRMPHQGKISVYNNVPTTRFKITH